VNIWLASLRLIALEKLKNLFFINRLKVKTCLIKGRGVIEDTRQNGLFKLGMFVSTEVELILTEI